MAADDAGISAKSSLPELIGKDCHRLCAGSKIRCGEAAAQQRMRSQSGEALLRNKLAEQVLRLLRSDQSELLKPRRSHRLERVHTPLDRTKIGRGEATGLALLVYAGDFGQPANIGIAEGTKQDGIDDTEERCRGPDPNRQRYYGHHSEPGGTNRRPKSKANTPEKRHHARILAHAG